MCFASPADAHDAGPVRGLCNTPSPADAHDAGLVGPADAHDAEPVGAPCYHTHPVDAHDAGPVGGPYKMPVQLMLMIRWI